METVELDRERFLSTKEEQANIGATDDGGLHRLALSDADADARDWLADQFAHEGLDVRIDEMGNMFGRRSGTDPDAPTVLVGSHLDSQPNGGRFDGALGVVAALEFVRSLEDQNISTRRPVEVVNWTNEEGTRFQPALQGSGTWAGVFDVDEQHRSTDADGNMLRDELERIGCLDDHPAEPRDEYAAYLELHIEQATRLESGGYDVGIVEGIVGVSRGRVIFQGESDHAGTTTMQSRRDALVPAADFVQGGTPDRRHRRRTVSRHRRLRRRRGERRQHRSRSGYCLLGSPRFRCRDPGVDARVRRSGGGVGRDSGSGGVGLRRHCLARPSFV